MAIEIEDALTQYLLADPAIQQLIGTRISPQKAPQAVPPTTSGASDFPHVTYHRISTRRPYSMDGPTNQAAVRLQLDCWGLLYNDAKAVAQAIRNSNGGSPGGKPLKAFRGTMSGFQVQGVFLEDDRDDFFPPQHADDKGVHRTLVEFVIWYGEN